MQVETWQVVAGILTILVGQGGTVWWGMKTTLNGTGARVEAIDKRTEKMQTDIGEHGERLASIEATLKERRQ